jgi:hypothetical protein
VVKPEENIPLVSVDGRIILTRILNKYGRRLWSSFIWLRIGTSGGMI